MSNTLKAVISCIFGLLCIGFPIYYLVVNGQLNWYIPIASFLVMMIPEYFISYSVPKKFERHALLVLILGNLAVVSLLLFYYQNSLGAAIGAAVVMLIGILSRAFTTEQLFPSLKDDPKFQEDLKKIRKNT